jgi:putative transposase
MARKKRSRIAGPIVHLCNRAAGHLTLFQSPFEYNQILAVFREALEKFPVSVFAFCIMPNHWHMLCQPPEPIVLSRFMHWFGTTHAKRWRISHESVGRGAVYQNRFRSHPVEGPTAFLKTAAYIERNALVAGLVQEAAVWPWGSACAGADFPLQPWPVSKPPGWKQLLARPLDEDTIRQIRYAQQSCLPLRI